MANIVENELIKSEIQDGLSQVDENLVVAELETAFDKETRTLRVYCVAQNKETQEQITIDKTF